MKYPSTSCQMRKSRPRARLSRLALTLAAALASGSLLSTCQTRLKGAVVSGTKDYFFTLLDPAAIIELLVGDADSGDVMDE